MKRIVWKWKANIEDYVGQHNVVGVKISMIFPRDDSLFGRDGWVGFEEEYNEASKESPIPKGNGPISNH